MKILHTSDWHLGQNFMGKSRIEEHSSFLNWLIKTIKEQNIQVLLVSGDIFDTGTPPNYALELYYNFLKELANIKTLKNTIITYIMMIIKFINKLIIFFFLLKI